MSYTVHSIRSKDRDRQQVACGKALHRIRIAQSHTRGFGAGLWVVRLSDAVRVIQPRACPESSGRGTQGVDSTLTATGTVLSW